MAETEVASLGDISFVLMSWNLESIKRRSSYKFAEHNRLQGKPTLQAVGGSLDDIKLDFSLHPFYGDPKANLEELRTAAAEFKPLGFVLAGEYLGLFVITGIDDTPERITIEGNQQILKIGVDLQEYVGIVVTTEDETGDEGFEYSEPVEGPA